MGRSRAEPESRITAFFTAYGLAAVFGFVLLEQLGAPIPAFPLLLLAGTKALADPMYGIAALLLGVAACLVGDFAWFWAGRRYGHRVLKLLCRVSLSPDSCVRQTESTYERAGAATLVFAKFVPGLATVAPPVAGALGLGIPRFLFYNSAGALLYCASGLLLGLLFQDQIGWLLERLETLGIGALVLLGAVIALYVAHRAWDRWRFLRLLRTARISVDQLYQMMERGEEPIVLDVRSRTHRELDRRRIPGARAVDLDNLEHALAEIPRDREVVVYCACPNEATAVKVAMLLRERGIHRVRPLSGGIDAWVAAGLVIEEATTP